MGERKKEPGLGWRRKKGSKQQGPVQVCNHFPLPLLYCSLWTDMLLLHPKRALLYMLLVCVCVGKILNVNLRHITLPHADGFSPGSIRPLSSRDHLNHFNVVYQVILFNVIYLESCVRIGVLVCHFHTHDDKLPGQSETPQIIVIDSSTPE